MHGTILQRSATTFNSRAGVAGSRRDLYGSSTAIAAIWEACQGTLGRARPDLHPDIRAAPYKNYMIFFRYIGDTVEIVNVIEGHRDIKALFRKSE